MDGIGTTAGDYQQSAGSGGQLLPERWRWQGRQPQGGACCAAGAKQALSLVGVGFGCGRPGAGRAAPQSVFMKQTNINVLCVCALGKAKTQVCVLGTGLHAYRGGKQ